MSEKMREELHKIVLAALKARPGSAYIPDDNSPAMGWLEAVDAALAPQPVSVPEDVIDAKRYRWLRDGDVSFETTDGMVFVGFDSEHAPRKLDAAIDAAMLAAAPAMVETSERGGNRDESHN